MDAIGRQNPALLAAIHANHDGFVAMMNEPITNTPPPAAIPAPAAAPGAMDWGNPAGGAAGGPNPAQLMQMLAVLPPEQRNQLAQSMGMTPQQLQGLMQMMASMPPEQLQQMAAMGTDLRQRIDLFSFFHRDLPVKKEFNCQNQN